MFGEEAEVQHTPQGSLANPIKGSQFSYAEPTTATWRSQGHKRFSLLPPRNWCVLANDSEEQTRTHGGTSTEARVCGVPSPLHYTGLGPGVAVPSFWAHLLDSRITAINSSKCVDAGQCLTVLAPSNAAWNLRAASLAWPTLSIEEKQKIIYGMYFESPKSGSIPTKLSTQNWQTAGVALPLIDVGFGKGALYNEIVGPRYAFSFSGTPAAYFINDAKVERADVDATNGMIQIMDKVVNYPYESMGFFQYLSQAQDLTKMLTLWNKLRITGTPLYTQLTNQIYMGKTLYATYFVVPDSVWNQLPPKTYQDLLDNETLMIKVLANHYAPNQLFYPRWVRGSSGRAINFYVGFPNDPLPEAVNTQSLTPGKMAGSVDNSALTITVQNSYAETVGLAVVLRNAVLIPVSAPLGYLSETTQDALARLSPTFLRVCTLDTACNAILQSTTEKTVFAPVDWTQFNTLSSANQSEYLKLMIVPERILRPQMTTDKYVTVGSIPDAIRFRTRNSVLNVEARTPGNGYVPVALADSESSGSDGVVYLVTGVPGLPTQTVRNFLGGDSAFRNYVNTGILDHQIRGGPYTFFAADNGALDAMRADANLGAKIYESVERRIYVLRRSVFPMQLLLNELNTSVMYDVATANNAFTLEYVRFVMQVEGGLNTATVNGTVTVSMTDGGYQCTDGWVYHVNKMFYVADDLTRSLCTMPACPKTN
ncbi:hypothetical protein EGR_00897 [Echinococcus granulosus]|uniref:Uncharacterized protein n=2 Tax=Echinococcus granulosus TaxID=6210 RepID=W6USS7_ECHGR|nr:hypothetical protein EGR_00897 [Echinococcus granulosus]EUB64353.1 hypothetical protein EGR_00897 [Echinococcus granulosus]